MQKQKCDGNPESTNTSEGNFDVLKYYWCVFFKKKKTTTSDSHFNVGNTKCFEEVWLTLTQLKMMSGNS